jgi:hypothetical protein
MGHSRFGVTADRPALAQAGRIELVIGSIDRERQGEPLEGLSTPGVYCSGRSSGRALRQGDERAPRFLSHAYRRPAAVRAA